MRALHDTFVERHAALAISHPKKLFQNSFLGLAFAAGVYEQAGQRVLWRRVKRALVFLNGLHTDYNHQWVDAISSLATNALHIEH